MNPSELFDIWAPPEVVWSKWVKPVLFAELGASPQVNPRPKPLPPIDLKPDSQSAIVVDLSGPFSVQVGLSLIDAGYRPVPLFNGTRGPITPGLGASAIIDNDPIIEWLCAGASLIAQKQLPIDAPPAFLLDSRRKLPAVPAPGRFDNRWVVFPQDFPSAGFLKSQGISRAVLIQNIAGAQPQDDLAHVLRRWQEAGLEIFCASIQDATADAARPGAGTDSAEARATESTIQPLLVQRPSRFRALWYAALAHMGLRRNSAGGFGSVVPQPSSSG